MRHGRVGTVSTDSGWRRCGHISKKNLSGDYLRLSVDGQRPALPGDSIGAEDSSTAVRAADKHPRRGAGLLRRGTWFSGASSCGSGSRRRSPLGAALFRKSRCLAIQANESDSASRIQANFPFSVPFSRSARRILVFSQWCAPQPWLLRAALPVRSRTCSGPALASSPSRHGTGRQGKRTLEVAPHAYLVADRRTMPECGHC